MEDAPATVSADGVECPSCGARFLAFMASTPCPGCGRDAPGDGAVIADAIRVYAENVRAYGRPIPPVIRVATLRDDYLYRALFFLKALDERAPADSEDGVIARSLEVLTPAADAKWRAHLEAYYRALLAARGPSEREK